MNSASRALMNLLQIGGQPQQQQAPMAGAHSPVSPAPVSTPGQAKICQLQDGVAKLEKGEMVVPVTQEPPAAAAQRVEVRTFTMYASTATKNAGRMVASNANYIAYVVKVKTGWGVRVLHLHTARKGLLRGHNKAITDMCFVDDSSDVIATVDERGDTIVHRLRDAADEIESDTQLCVRRSTMRDTPYHRVAWMDNGRILAVAHDTMAELYDLGILSSVRECERADLGQGVLTLAGHTANIRDIAMSEDTVTLLTASEDGSVRFWDTQGSCMRTWQPHGGAAVTGIAYVRGGLVTGAAENTVLRLWAGESLHMVQSVELKCDSALALNLSSDASGRYVVLAATAPATAVFVLAMPEDEELGFVEVREFAVTQSVLSFVPAGTMRVDEEVEGDDAQQGERTVSLEALYVYAVQTKAIQQLCFKFPPPEVAPEGNGSTPADARGVQLLSPMALLAADDQSGAPSPLPGPAHTPSPRTASPVAAAAPVVPSAMTPPAHSPAPSPMHIPAAASPVPLPTGLPPRPQSPFEAAPAPPAYHPAPVAPALDVTALLAAVEGLIRQSETRITAHVDWNLDSRWAAFEAQQQQREKAAEERLRTAMLDTVQKSVDTAVKQSMTGIEQTLRTAVSAQLDRGALAKAASDAMVQPLTSAFVQIIHQNLVPAYEALTQTMMGQLKSAMDNATADYLEHVQRETRIHGQPLAIQTTLRELQSSVSALKSATEANASQLTSTLHSALDTLQADVKESLRTTVKTENRELLRQHSATTQVQHQQQQQPLPQQQAAPMPAPARAPTSRPSTATPPQPQQPQQATQKPPATTAQSAAAKQAADEVWAQINKALINEDYASAFSKALSSMSLGVVLRLCRTVDIDAVLRQRPCPLSQPILLSLIQQLSVDLLHDTQLKVHVIAEAVRGVDPTSPVARQHLPALVPQIASNIRAAHAHLAHTPEGPALHALLTSLVALA